MPGQAVLVCPASCAGAITFKRTAGLALDDETITVGETSTLPYAVRIVAPGRINIFHKLSAGVYVAGLPRSGTARLLSMIQDVYPGTEAADSVFQTTLQNGNPVIHPAVTLLNAGLIERTGGGFLFYEEGVTEAVGRAIEAVDRERLAIADVLGVRVLSEPELGVAQGYMREANYSTGYSTAPGFLGIGAQSQLDNRYLTEDVGYSLVFLADLARRVGVETPTMDALITLASVVLARDFRAEGVRTLATLGLDDMSATTSPPSKRRIRAWGRPRLVCFSGPRSQGAPGFPSCSPGSRNDQCYRTLMPAVCGRGSGVLLTPGRPACRDSRRTVR